MSVVKSAGRGLLGSFLIYLIAVLVVGCLGCLLIFIPMQLYASGDYPAWAMIVPAALFVLVLFGGGGVMIFGTLAARKRRLNAAFGPFGLTGSSYNLMFRQYHGLVRGRQVDVYFYRGPVLDIDIGTRLQTRLGAASAASDTGFFARLFNRPPMNLHPNLSDLLVFPHEEEWAREALADAQIVALLRALVNPAGDFTRQNVLLRPGSLRLQLSGTHKALIFNPSILPEDARRWLETLFDLLERLEALPAPRITVQPSQSELDAAQIRKTNWTAIGLIFGLLTLFCVVGGGIALTLIILRMSP